MSKTRSAREAALLLALARAPLISATDLSTVAGQGTGANPGPDLRALQAAGLVEYVTPSSALVTSQRLYYLTGWGVHQAALNRGEKPAAFAQRWSLGERALLRRLTRLEHLLLTRGLLLDLQRGLEQEGGQGGVSLVRWRPWPVRWTFDSGRGRWRTLRLDGVGALSRIGVEGEAAFALLWDHGDADVDALRPRLRAALEARAAWARALALVRPFPTVLLVSTSLARADAVRRIAGALADDLAVEPLDLLSTAAEERLISSAAGPLDAAVRWRGGAAQGDEQGLVRQLLTRIGPPAVLPAWEEGQEGLTPGAAMAGSNRTGASLVRGRFTERGAALTTRMGAGPSASDLGIVALALRPREARALRWIGLQPLCRAGDIAELAQDSPGHIGETLAHLRSLDLIRAERFSPGVLPVGSRYILTFAGLRLLAARAGLAPGAYLRYTGSSAAARQTRSGGARARRRGRYLAWMARYGEHTAGMQAVYLGFVRAARAAGQAHALEEWRGEWACVRYFAHDGAWQILRPDAVGRYRAGAEELSFFVELDRGTYGPGVFRAKLAAYSAYRASGAWARGSPAFPTMLVVTSDEKRLRTILTLNLQVAAARLALPLDMVVATREALDRHGVHGPIWHEGVTLPPRRLFSPAPRPLEGAAGRQGSAGDTPLSHGCVGT